MKLWDLNSDLIFPPSTILAYVKNILHYAKCDVVVTSHVSTMVGYHWLKGVTRDGVIVDLYAPYAKADVVTMFIPFIMQRTFGTSGDFRWSTDGRKSNGCFRIAKQDEDTEFRMISNRAAFLQYAYSGKLPQSYFEEIEYPRKRSEYIARETAKGIMGEAFRFVDNQGQEKVVPFITTVFNSRDNMEKHNVAPRSLPAPNRPAIGRI